MDSSKASSNSITSSTVSRESALRSLMKCVSRVISLLSTPICSLTISITFCSVSSIIVSLPALLEFSDHAFPGHSPITSPRANAARKTDDYSGDHDFPQPIDQPPITCDPPHTSSSTACLHHHPAIHTNYLSRHITRIRTRQKRHHRRHFLGCSKTL